MPSRGPHSALVPVVVLALGTIGTIGTLGCGRREPAPEPPTVHRGPILLVTFDALRADMVAGLGGERGLTPALDRLIVDAHWAGRAVAPSSWTVPAMASLVTGRQPWEHGALSAEAAALPDGAPTLAEALKRTGYTTAAYHSGQWLGERFGYGRGFDVFGTLGRQRAATRLAGLSGRPELLWVHVFQPHAPYQRRDRLAGRLRDTPAELPERVRPVDLERWADPATPPPAEVAATFRAMYRLNAAWADEQLGVLLDALRASGRYDETMIVVAADHGEALGEASTGGRFGHGWSLGRAEIEVPLVVKLPRGWRSRFAARESERVGIVRLWATVVEAAGGTVPEGVAPSLFQDGEPGTLSELYLGNGVNELSLVDGAWQVRWTTRFAAPEPEYLAARLARQGGRPAAPLSEPAEAIFGRLGAAFAVASPLLGTPGAGAGPEVTLERWTGGSGTETVDDPERRARMARLLERRWLTAASRLPGRPGHPPGTPPLLPDERAALTALGSAR